MEGSRPALLCVDDEVSILNALKRLLRKEGYRLFTAVSAEEGFEILSREEIQVVICDQRMPNMDGITFLKKLMDIYPDIIRITLTGYTDIDTIREAVNQGHIFKFLLKPWNDDNLILEIRHAFIQYELISANRELNKKVMAKNEELKHLNDHLESLVKQRTEEIMIRNQALELSRAILNDIPIPILGVSSDGMIAMTNYALDDMFKNAFRFEVGRLIDDYFPADVTRHIIQALSDQSCSYFDSSPLGSIACKIQCAPLSGSFMGRGIILLFQKINAIDAV